MNPLTPATLAPPGAVGPGQSEADKPEEMQAARDFEAILVRQLLGAMRRSSAALGGAEPSFGRGMYTEMLDEQLAQNIVSSGGLGLADVLFRAFGDAGVQRSPSAADALVQEGGDHEG